MADTLECVCVPENIMFAAGMPVAASSFLFASSQTSRPSEIVSATAKASFVVPSSSTRQRTCNSSCTCIAMGRGAKFPTISMPSGGVMLLVAAPARNSAA